MARNNNGNQPRNVRRDSASGSSLTQKTSKTATVISKKDNPSKADKMFQRAWKDTYDKRDRRVG